MIQQGCPFLLVSPLLHIDLWKQIRKLELAKAIWFVGDISSIYGDYEQTWKQIKKDDLAESSVVSSICWYTVVLYRSGLLRHTAVERFKAGGKQYQLQDIISLLNIDFWCASLVGWNFAHF